MQPARNPSSSSSGPLGRPLGARAGSDDGPGLEGRAQAGKTDKCGVLGAGWWGTTAHIPALKRHPSAELVAVHSNDPAMARKIAADFEVPHACSSVDEVLGAKDIEAVIISSTPNMHYAHAEAALRHGLHVLIEKPMTILAAEAEALVSLAAQMKRHFLISCPWHYTRHSIEARSLVLSGRLGQIKMVSVLMTNFTVGLFRGLSWDEIFGRSPTAQNSSRPYCTPLPSSYCDPRISGGGQIYSQISHAAAHLGFVTNRLPVSVFAQFDKGGTAVDVHNTLSIKLDDGALVSIASTGATPDSQRNYEVRVYGTQGLLMMELWKGTMECHLFNGEVFHYPALNEDEIYPLFAPATNFVNLILGRETNGSPADLGFYAMKVIEGACEYESADRRVDVDTTSLARSSFFAQNGLRDK